MNILVTGGAGYIGSHTCVELINAGHDVVVVDNLCNSKENSLDRVCEITGKRPKFYNADLRDVETLRPAFSENSIDAVIHFAGLKAVGESVAKPWEYYNNNVGGTLNLIAVMKEFGVKNLHTLFRSKLPQKLLSKAKELLREQKACEHKFGASARRVRESKVHFLHCLH